jgi:hypothetical protein
VFRRLFVVAICVAACGHDHGPPTVKPKPKPSDNPALRGGGAPRSPRIASYKIDARLDAPEHRITGATETLTWTNSGQSAVDVLPFHLYLNAFKNESSLFWRSSGGSVHGARAIESGWGWIQLESVQVGGVELVGKLHYPNLPDETVVELPLAQAVQPGQTIEVSFKFSEQLPEVWARTGYKGEFHMVGQWFPKIGVRVGTPGAEHWECQPFHSHSEFFADFGTYDVTLTVPNTLVVAATGVLADSADLPGGTRTLTYHAEDVHDFAWMADPYMTMISGVAKVEDGSVDVRVYYRPEQEAFAKRHLAAGVAAIEKFSAAYLPYPWATMSIIDPPVDAFGGAGGMEYPTLVTTGGDSVFARPGLRLPETVTIHEVGHNWFQGMLASNEPEEGWLDEGVNEWADARAMADIYGARTSAVDWLGWQADMFALRRVVATDPGSIPAPIATATYAFPDFDSYGDATYTKTMNALRTLEQTVGSVKFQAAMKAYARAFAFKHPTGRDLYATLERELDQDLSWFIAPVFGEVGGMELGIRTAECREAHPPRGVFTTETGRKIRTETEAPNAGAWVCEVVVQNTGRIHIPLDIELRFADGATQRVHWDDRGNGNWQRFVIERSSKLTEVNLDPDGKISLDSPIAHRYRLEADGSASLRSAARISTWAQTLMQLVGP